LVKNNQSMLDTLEAKKNTIEAKQKEFDVIKADVEAPNAEGTNTAAKLKAAADAYQSKYDAWARTKEAADRSAENYTKALAEVATRDALIDTLNSGSLKVTSKDANGNWQLSNGMTLTTQGKFMQDGVQVFANAAGIPQKVMDFRANDGSNVDFDDDAGRLMSETDVATIAKRDFGFEPTDEEAEALAGGMYTNQVTAPITELATKKARDTYFAVTGKEPTASELLMLASTGLTCHPTTSPPVLLLSRKFRLAKHTQPTVWPTATALFLLGTGSSTPPRTSKSKPPALTSIWKTRRTAST